MIKKELFRKLYSLIYEGHRTLTVLTKPKYLDRRRIIIKVSSIFVTFSLKLDYKLLIGLLILQQ